MFRLGIGFLFSVTLIVMIFCLSCAAGRVMCPSGFGTGTGMNSMNTNGGKISEKDKTGSSINNIIPDDDKEIIKNKNKDSSSITSTSSTTTVEPEPSSPTEVEGTTSTEQEQKPYVTLFAGSGHYGLAWDYPLPSKTSCQNLPPVMRNRIQSINTQGHCITLCDKLECGGLCIRFAPGTLAHHRFRKLSFHNRAESVIGCD